MEYRGLFDDEDPSPDSRFLDEEQPSSSLAGGLPEQDSASAAVEQSESSKAPRQRVSYVPTVVNPSVYYIECSADKSKVFARTKTKLCCFRFPQTVPQTREQSISFLNAIAQELKDVRQGKSGSHRLLLKCATFFVLPDGVVWFALVSDSSAYFSKWNNVFHGLKALEGRMFFSTKTRLQESILGVPLMFPTTNVVELNLNMIQIHVVEVRPRVPCPSSLPVLPVTGWRVQETRKRQRITALHMALKRVSGASTPQIGPSDDSMEAPAVSVEDQIAPQHQQVPVPRLPSMLAQYSGDSDALLHECINFLNAPRLDNMHACTCVLRRFLTSPGINGSLGLYLLDGNVAEMFTRVTVLKDGVLDVLKRRYGLDLPTLDLREIMVYESKMDERSIALLKPLVEFHHAFNSMLTFAMFDPVCVNVYLVFHILRCRPECRAYGLSRVAESSFFLHRDAYVLCEFPWVFARFLRLLHDFLKAQIAEGYVAPEQYERWLLVGNPTVEEVTCDLSRGFPIAVPCTSPPKVNKFTYRVRQHRRMMDEIMQKFGIRDGGDDEETGIAIRIWRRAQEQRQIFLYNLRTSSRDFTLLPANKFSPFPERHSVCVHDVCRFYRIREPVSS